ncbi:MAG: TGS domain-containing protein, partial [Deltaproteobacteria bacterium]|nr:TGS domain-containing protein [Deltaproteobacteria bacterium]
MNEIKITLPDGSVAVKQAGTIVRDILLSWDPEKARTAVVARLNGALVDLSHPVEKDATLDVVGITSEEGLSALRHSISHVMAQAVQDLFEGVKVTIGPSIEDGFYYDFEYENTFTPEDLEKIEKRMAEIVAADHPFERREVSREEAIELFQKRGENYKVELITDLPGEVKTVSLYTQGDFVDLCRGPH